MFKSQTVFTLMLAATVALAGCQSPVAPTSSAQLTPAAKQQAGVQASQTTAQAMAEEREMANYGYFAEADGQPMRYGVMSVDHESPEDEDMAAVTASFDGEDDDDDKDEKADRKGKGNDKGFKGKLQEKLKEKLKKQREKMKEKAKKALEKMKDEERAIAWAAKNAKWVKNPDGTETKSYSFKMEKTVNGQASSRSVEMTRTRRSDDKSLVSSHTAISESGNGVSRSMVRDEALQEDGSYAYSFHSEMTFKDGSKRVADWSKVVTADGAVSGEGSIVWTGKMTKTITVSFGGTEEAETATTTDPTTNTQAEVTTTPDGNATAEVKDPATGATTEVKVEADPDAIAESPASPAPESPAPEATASPEPDASASPAPEATAAETP